MRRTLLLLCALLAVASSAFAQAHQCDTAPPGQATVTQNVPHKVQFCSPATDNVEAAVGYIDGVPSSLQPVVALGPKSTVSGLVLYETPLFLSISNRGNHSLQVSAYNRNASGVSQEGAKSTPPFVFAVASEFPLALALTADKASPQVKGSVVTFTATASGGIAPYQFKWLLNGAVWSNWSSSNIRTWDTASATPGTYTVEVWSRSSDITTDTAEAKATTTFTLTAPTVPAPVAPVIRGVLR